MSETHTLFFLPSIVWILDQPISYLSSAVFFVKNLCLSFRLFPLYFSSLKSSSSFLRRSLLGNPGQLSLLSGLDLHSFLFSFFFFFFLTWLQVQGQFEILEEFWWFFIFNLFLVLILRFLEGSEKHANICGPP